VLANLALIFNLPAKGVITGVVLILMALAAYLAWGGSPDVEDLYEEVVPPTRPGLVTPAAGGAAEGEPVTTEETATRPGDQYRILVAVGRPERAAQYAKLAATLGSLQDEDLLVQVVTVTHIPDQTPWESVRGTARGRTQRIQDLLAAEDIGAKYTVEGHVCKDIAFDIVQTAREDGADLIVMGYPEEHTQVAEGVEYKAPCGVLFVSGLLDPTELDVVNVGAGGGPHHTGMLPLVERMGEEGAELHVINVDPGNGPGRPETTEATLGGLTGAPSVEVQNVSASSIANGLVTTASENGGILVIGATRTRRIGRWVFGSTPDRVIELAEGASLPVLVYASPRGVQGPVEDYLYSAYRLLRGRPQADATDQSSTETNQ
jgi:nucleotide-binding universal stress UspA family protein